MAKHLAEILNRSLTTLARVLLDAGDDAEAVVRRYQPKEPAASRKVPSHDEVALRFLQERLNSGPCPVSVLDDKVEAGRLRMGSVDKAKIELNLTAHRVNRGRGSVVHLCTEAQARALELEATEA